MNYLYFLLLLNYNGFELMSAWYNNNTSNILFSLISLIRHFKKLWTLNFVILMSASSYEWNVSQSAVWQCSLETHPFFLDCFVSCGLILWIAIRKNICTPKIYFSPVSCNQMLSPTKIKCNVKPPSKTTCSTFSKIAGAFQTKSTMALVRGGISVSYI